jgi:hypothetical protein
MRENRKAAEAYHLMQYKCKTCGKLSLIWNSRDAVTPFMVSCPCGGQRSHVNWRSDIRMSPEYIPPPGYCDVFIDLSPERAKELAIKRVDSFDKTEYRIPKATKEYDDMVHRLTESYVNDCCSVDIISSEEYGKLCGKGEK